MKHTKCSLFRTYEFKIKLCATALYLASILRINSVSLYVIDKYSLFPTNRLPILLASLCLNFCQTLTCRPFAFLANS